MCASSGLPAAEGSQGSTGGLWKPETFLEVIRVTGDRGEEKSRPVSPHSSLPEGPRHALCGSFLPPLELKMHLLHLPLDQNIDSPNVSPEQEGNANSNILPADLPHRAGPYGSPGHVPLHACSLEAAFSENVSAPGKATPSDMVARTEPSSRPCQHTASMGEGQRGRIPLVLPCVSEQNL